MSDLTINLDDEYRIRRYDSLNVVVERLVPGGKHPTTGEIGKDKWRILGFYGGLSQALSRIPDHLAMNPEIATLAEYRRRWDKLCEGFLR